MVFQLFYSWEWLPSVDGGIKEDRDLFKQPANDLGDPRTDREDVKAAVTISNGRKKNVSASSLLGPEIGVHFAVWLAPSSHSRSRHNSAGEVY